MSAAFSPLAVPPLPEALIRPAVEAALLEDWGRAGDVTTDATIPMGTQARAAINAREPGVAAGVQVAELAFRLVDPSLTIVVHLADGERMAKGDAILTATGEARSILMAERVALNFMGRMCGIASLTRRIADSIAHTKAKIADTRKTTPGMRIFEKRAVKLGGGANHRFGLDDAILIKDNHLVAAGGIRPALERARAYAGHMLKIELEVDSLDQLDEALKIGIADNVLLDNMSPEILREAVRRADLAAEKGGRRPLLEASGGISPETAPKIAETGVDLLSAGFLTHSVKVLDVGLDFS